MELPLTIKEAAALLRSGDTTSVELTTAYLEKIDALNPTLGAFIVVMHDSALAEARAADALFAQGIDRGAMQGIPYAAKDLLATQNAPTTANSVVLDPAWGEGLDAAVIERLRDAGAVLVGKTVLNEFATGGPDPDKKHFPMPQNPWDLPRSASGSSSGTGIAIAAGLALGGLGSDTGGSTRGPSSFNGCTGMKQTFGRVSKFGAVPLGYSLDGVNPLARSAYDCALMLNVMAGYDPRDPTTVQRPVPDYTAGLTGSVEGVRIGVPMQYFFDSSELDPETRDTVLAAIDLLNDAGAIITEVVVPHAADAQTANTIIMAGESLAYHRPDLGTRFDDYGKFTAQSLGRGALYSAGDYVQAQRFRSYFRAQVAKLFETIDVLITPTSIGPAPLREEMQANPDRQALTPSFTGLWNLTGTPAMALPVGHSNELHLPLSMQLIGAAFDEATVFQVGDAYQQLTDFHLQVPPLAQRVAVA